ncbi:MAG TPA: DUF447 domain-containing protein [Pirellulales bacterium]|jgi:hypothetical protein
MILEGIVTTINADGTVNISPMGPIVDDALTRLELRPFQTSTTFQNLRRARQGVFHVSDDVELLARAAVGRLETPPRMVRSVRVDGWILADACRFYAFEVRELDESDERARLVAEVVDSGRARDFFGFNRAKHAVVEAAILATRVHFLPRDEIMADFARWNVLVEKTGGPQERRAFDFLEAYVRDAFAKANPLSQAGTNAVNSSAPGAETSSSDSSQHPN